MSFPVLSYLSAEINRGYFSIFNFILLLANQPVDRNKSHAIIKILITCIMDLYHRKSYKCFFLSEGKIRLRNVKETLKRIGPSTDPRDSFHNFCSHCTKDEVFQ